MESINSMSMKKAVIINAGSKYTQVIVQLIINIILARLLSPQDYGIAAVVTVFVSFFNILADMGLGSAVIQNKELTDRDVSHIFSFSCFLGVILGVLFFVLSFGIAAIYANNCYIQLGALLSFSVVFNTFNMIPKAVLMKEKRFIVVGMRTIISAIASGVVAVLLAYLNAGYYALIFQTVTSALIVFFWNYINVRISFKFKVDFACIKKVIGFSFYQFGFSIINYFSRNLDNLLVGKIFGEAPLGIYSKSYQLMTYPINNLTSVVTPALQPILSDYQKTKEIIYEKYMKVFSLLALMGAFVGAFCYIGADEIIRIFYGAAWIEAIPYFRILSLSIFAQMVYVSAPSIFLSLGNSKRLFLTSIINTLVTICGIALGIVHNSLIAITIGVTVAYNLIMLHTFVQLVKKGFSYSFYRFYKKAIIFVAIHLILLVAVYAYPLVISNIFLSIIAKFIYLGVIYVFLMIITRTWGIYIQLLKRRKKIK